MLTVVLISRYYAVLVTDRFMGDDDDEEDEQDEDEDEEDDGDDNWYQQL